MPLTNRSIRRLAIVGVVGLLAVAAGGCGGSDDDASSTSASTPSTAAATTTLPPRALRILVTNDDGVAAPGIDALVAGLETLPDVEITVVAPADQQSGTGGKTTDGPLTVTDATTASGYPAKAVDGFPADTIRAAFDDLGIEADLVVSGINLGQNIGPLVDASGTVGAARAAVAAGVPALATSQGLGQEIDYPAAVPLILDWVTEHRSALLTGNAAVQVDNLNVPSCAAGEVRGVEEVPVGVETGNVLLQVQDCTSTLENPADDVVAFNNGFAALTVNLRDAA